MESRTSPLTHQFRLDLDGYQLLDGNFPVRLEKQPMELLILLAERRGQLVTRGEIAAALWSDGVFVDTDRNINSIVRKLRHALKDDPDHPQFVETVVGKGYRFIGPVEVTSREKAPSSGVGSRPVASAPARSAFRLRLLLAAAAVVAVAVLAWLAIRRNESLRTEQAPIRSLAILPLENLSTDPEQEYFAEGMTDELITDLAQMTGLRVTSRSSVMHYKHTQKTLPEIASELRVDAVVEGTLVRVGDRVRIRVQLIRAADDRHLWAQAYDREYRDVLLLQSEASRDIAQAINLKLASNPLDRSRARPVSPEAYDAYLKGRYFWNRRSREGHGKAVAYFEQAVQLAPDSAMGYSGLADAYLDGVWMAGEAPSVAAAKARAAVTKALELDPNLAEAHVSLAGILEVYDWNWAEADKEYRRGLELNPNSAVHQSPPQTWIPTSKASEFATEICRVSSSCG